MAQSTANDADNPLCSASIHGISAQTPIDDIRLFKGSTAYIRWVSGYLVVLDCGTIHKPYEEIRGRFENNQ